MIPISYDTKYDTSIVTIKNDQYARTSQVYRIELIDMSTAVCHLLLLYFTGSAQRHVVLPVRLLPSCKIHARTRLQTHKHLSLQRSLWIPWHFVTSRLL